MPDTTIYHNPNCSTSRKVLAMLRESGAEPQVVEYLKTPLTAPQLQALLHRLGIPARALLRQKGPLYESLGLGAAHWSEEQLIEHIAAHPELMERPVVVTAKGARLCRPVEAVWEILPSA